MAADPRMAILNKEEGIGMIGTNITGGILPALPMAPRAKFMKALIAEQDGDNVLAASLLDEAVLAESKSAL